MKKCIFIIATILLIATGCSQSAYETYNAALEKTETADVYKSLLDVEIHLTFDEELMDIEEYKELRNFESTALRFTSSLDHKNDRSMIRVDGSIFGKGIQGKIYQNKNEVMVVSPLFPKILVLQSEELKGKVPYQGEKYSKETFRELSNLWRETINKDNIASIGNVVISTPEGEIKAKEFHMDLKEEDMMPFIEGSLEILLRDESFREMILKDVPEGIDMEEELKKLLENTLIKEVKQYAFIDRDNYIAEESFSMNMEIEADNSGINSFDITMNTQNWDFNKELTIELPKVHQGNIMGLDEIMGENPFIIRRGSND